jgi:hypothetical protein
VAVSGAALLLNPNGVTHILFLLETTLIPRPEIVEWAPIAISSVVGIAYLALVAVVGFGLARSRRELDLSLVVPMVIVMVTLLLAERHLQLFVPAVIVLGAPYIARVLGRAADGAPESRAAIAVLLVVAIATSLFSVGRVAVASPCPTLDARMFVFPTRGVQALREAGVTGNAVVPFNWGQFIIWHLGPDLKVSGDGRRETVYSQEVHQANLDFANGEGDWDRILDYAPADLVIQVTGTPGAQLIAGREGWEVVYQDDVATVAAPDGTVPTITGDMDVPADGHGLCFPAEAR